MNHNISSNKKKYKNLVPKDCGSKYTLLRDEREREFLCFSTLFEKIFMAMGGADHSKNIRRF